MLEIKDWHQRYEVSKKNREAKPGEELRLGPLRYIRLKVHGYQQGTGMRKLKHIAGNRAMEVFGIFCKFLEIAGDSGKDTRGQLLNEDGKPADAQDLAFILDVPEEQITNAITVLLNPKLAWLVQTNSTDTKDNTIHTYTQGAGKVRENPDGPDITLSPEDSNPTYHHGRDIPPQETDRPNEDVTKILEAWAESRQTTLEQTPPTLLRKAMEQAEIYADKGLEWCLAAIAASKEPYLGVRFVDYGKHLKATTTSQAEQARLQKLEDHNRAQIKATRDKLRKDKERFDDDR